MVFGRLNFRQANPANMGRDKRKHTRRPLGRTAWIRPEGGFAVRPCEVINLSDTGVCIAISTPGTVPSTFNLVFSRGAGMGQRAYIKWRKGNRIGAEFF